MANTDWKITSLDGSELFNFNNTTKGIGSNWEPSMLNTSTTMGGDVNPLPWNNLTAYYNTGLNARNLVLSGELLEGSATVYQNQYRLSYCVADREVKKLWRGDDWFSYVLGQETRPTFDSRRLGYLIRRFTVSFNVPYPVEYHANSSDGITPVPQTATFSGSPLTATVDTTAAVNSNYNHWHILPNFFVSGAFTSVTITFEDDEGRQLVFTPSDTATGTDGWVIMPYSFRETPQGFNPQVPVAYKMANSTSIATSEWLQDLNPYDNTDFSQSSNLPVRVYPTLQMKSSPDGKRNNSNPYPRFKAYDSSATITATVTGTATDLAITAQYLLVRIP